MITYTQGNLLEAPVEALVNTVNTVGVMGKGIALMFRERFDRNYREYAAACKAGQVNIGKMFVTETGELDGPRWIINFPTKKDWRGDSRIEWIDEGLRDLKRVLVEMKISSVAVPPLGAGNGGLDWPTVRGRVTAELGELTDIQVVVYEPTNKYQNVAKRAGVEKLTASRALVAELVRRYSVLGIECSRLEIQKLVWFLGRVIQKKGLRDELRLVFKPHRYGPYAPNLDHLLDKLDGSYLHSDKRIADSGPWDLIWFDEDRKELVQAYLKSEAKDFLPALEGAAALIDGFESPFGMELLASVDWLMAELGVAASVAALREGLAKWPADGVQGAGERKSKLFEDRAIEIAMNRLTRSELYSSV